jgi:hypothetical protein
MKLRNARLIAAIVAATLAQASLAGTDIFFEPLTQSAPVAPGANSAAELGSPWVVPAGITQRNLTSLREVEADIAQSIVRVPGLGSSAAMIDMIAYDPTGKFLFLPHETLVGAGVTRYDIEDDSSVVLFRGDTGGLVNDWSKDWGAFDPSTWTPNDTLFLAEEWSGQGRVVEVMNPLADPADIEIRELESVANVSHEGLRFSNNARTLYFVDEFNSGSIYKLVLKNKHDYTSGQTFVLKVDGFQGHVAVDYNAAANVGQPRTGTATWVPLTDKHGNPLTATDPFANSLPGIERAGRQSADEAGGTPYGRPEDIEVGTLANGREAVYFAATSENTVYTIEMIGSKKAVVKMLLSETGTPKNAGFAATTGKINSPDNLAQDRHGNIYVIEDAPNGSSTGGDIWFARDTDSDGVAESVDHFMSIRVAGSEATGMIFNPVKPNEFTVSVQHPNSTDLDKLPSGFGDALWTFDMSALVPEEEAGQQLSKTRRTR